VKVTLLSSTPEPEKVIAAAAKLCYSDKADIDSLMNDLTPDKVSRFVNKLESLGHESPMEHISFTFGIEGVSRSLLAQITRHRLASFSVRSQRYCSEKDFDYVIPPTIRAHQKHCVRYKALMAEIGQFYEKLIELGIPKEDARMVLPNACETRMIMTMNARELFHFASLRACTRAQWEIRALAKEIISLAKDKAPVLFKHLGAACEQKGYCPEGSMSCGCAPTLSNLEDAYYSIHHLGNSH
jgi:thymidylate synthase (FAD)